MKKWKNTDDDVHEKVKIIVTVKHLPGEMVEPFGAGTSNVAVSCIYKR